MRPCRAGSPSFAKPSEGRPDPAVSLGAARFRDPAPQPTASFLSRIYAMNLALARRQERRQVIGVGACLPVRQAQGPELVEGQAILTAESRASSLLQFA